MAMTNGRPSLFDFEASETETGSYDDYEKMKAHKLEAGVEFTGFPIINWYENKEKKYDAIRLRIVDDEVEQLLDCYINIPKKDPEGNIRRLNESFTFYNTAFNFVKNTIELVDGVSMDRIKQFNRINIQQILEVYEDASNVGIRIVKESDDDEYNTFVVTQIG